MDSGFYSHTEYWFENARVRFYPQEGHGGLCPTGYRVLVDGHKGETYLAINIDNSQRPSKKYAKLIVETLC